LKKIGSEKICLGTDYPFPLGDLEIGTFIEHMNLEPVAIENMFNKSTLEWLKLDKKDFI
jgi:aminocarboxymuconate-semialdehyde decarboxylase